ncbi:hypothetical protein J2Z49_001405 [Desulfofundulus luciae]|uniref:Uncharacterized protein n=1 Tax=Desulfofundulus luciae TaxID=74702 RepID=A0ABU0B0P7_9FIRM|nr:hypothetical protein [Desulfofundulus luciae]MDQ0286291.1 hypothetical protein [Desulfofundulus luciae]
MNLNNAAALILIILIAYYLGHFAQALGNLLSKLFPNVEELMLSGNHSDGIPNTILEAVRLKISETFDVEVSELKPEWVYAICDETVMQNGVSLDREVYQYREGFYRGMGISLLLFSLSIIIRGIVPGAFFRISGADQSINCTIVLFIFFISLGGSILSYLRYLRFGRYRVKQAIMGFLVLTVKRNLNEG